MNCLVGWIVQIDSEVHCSCWRFNIFFYTFLNQFGNFFETLWLRHLAGSRIALVWPSAASRWFSTFCFLIFVFVSWAWEDLLISFFTSGIQVKKFSHFKRKLSCPHLLLEALFFPFYLIFVFFFNLQSVFWQKVVFIFLGWIKKVQKFFQSFSGNQVLITFSLKRFENEIQTFRSQEEFFRFFIETKRT